MRQREADPGQPCVLSDALIRNEADDTPLMRWHCLAQGRRKFSALAHVFPHECAVVIERLTHVFAHDAEARVKQRSPPERVAYHQEYSRPLMDELTRWLETPCADRLVEPNSSLGKAMASLRGHWDTLTRFSMAA